MAGEEAETRLRSVGEGADELSLPQLLRNVSFASAAAAGDGSFRFSLSTSSDVSFRSFATHVESDDDDAMYRMLQSECEEIPSFRWIASSLRWWGTRRTRDVSFPPSVASSAEEELGDHDVRYPWMQSDHKNFLSFRWMATLLQRWRTRNRTEQTEERTAAGRKTRGNMVYFDRLPALVRTSMELVGKGTHGTLYKAMLEDGRQVALKRLQGEMVSEFEAEVTQLGKIRHSNLLTLRAYYFSQDDKLLVYDYMPKGNLSAFLHARSPGNPIDWGTRLKIATGITWGLHYLHTREKTVHGSLTSRNILPDDCANAKIADYGLYRLVTTAANSTVTPATGSWALRYRAPELTKLKEPNTKTDVYSLGVVLLELFTGKAPGEAIGGVDLHHWVITTIREGRSLEVFDEELRERRSEDLFYALNVALHCMNPSPDARPEVAQVLHQLSEINAYLAMEEWSRIHKT